MTSIEAAAVLFALDGVLVDSTPLVTRLWNAWAEDHGLDPAEVLAQAYGQRTVDTMRNLGVEDAEEQAAAYDEREASETQGLRAFPGARDLLSARPRIDEPS